MLHLSEHLSEREIDFKEIERSTTLEEFDGAYTAKYHNYRVRMRLPLLVHISAKKAGLCCLISPRRERDAPGSIVVLSPKFSTA